jgi:hypothetical protein
VICALFHRFDRHLDARISRQQDDQRVGIGALDLLEDVEAVAVRQFVIEEHEVDAFAKPLERIGGRRRLHHPIALIVEPAGQRPPNELFIVDDENRGGPHRLSLYRPRI